jgi:hypothetical protein
MTVATRAVRVFADDQTLFGQAGQAQRGPAVGLSAKPMVPTRPSRPGS